MMTTTTRTDTAKAAYLVAYEHPKADSKDALLAMNQALYTHVETLQILRMWDHHGTMEEVADSLWERECDGVDEQVIADEFVPVIDDAMSGFLADEARQLGVDVEEERCDWSMVAEMLSEIRQLPASQRASAVAAVNDGATVDARHLYRQEA